MKERTHQNIALGLGLSTILVGAMIASVVLATGVVAVIAVVQNWQSPSASPTLSALATLNTEQDDPFEISGESETSVESEISTIPVVEEPVMVNVEDVRQLEAKEKWLACMTKLREACDLRRQLASQVATQIESDLRWAKSQVSYSEFIESIESMSSQWNAVTSRETYATWVSEQFTEHVFSQRATERMLTGHMHRLQQALNAINDETLIAMQIDSNLDGRAIVVPEVTTVSLSRELQTLSEKLEQDAIGVVVQEITKSFTGLMAGEIAFEALRPSLAYNSQGEYSLFGDALAMIGSMAAGAIAEEMTEQTMGTSLQLKQTLQSGIDSIYSALQSTDPARCGWRKTLVELVQGHDLALGQGVIEALGVDPQWANEQWEAIMAVDTSN